MGEKRKARMSNNERTSKKEKKTNKNIVLSSASNDEIEEQSSMHSNSSNSDSNSQQPSIAPEDNHPEEIEESQAIPSIDVETVIATDPIECNPSTPIDPEKIPNGSTTNKSWWSSFVRLFHFGQTTTTTTTTTSTEIKSSLDDQTSTFVNAGYLGNVKSRRSLHGDALVG